MAVAGLPQLTRSRERRARYRYAIKALLAADASLRPPLEPDALYAALREVTFDGVSGGVVLDGSADRIGAFDILNVRLQYGYERFAERRRLDIELPPGEVSFAIVGVRGSHRLPHTSHGPERTCAPHSRIGCVARCVFNGAGGLL